MKFRELALDMNAVTPRELRCLACAVKAWDSSIQSMGRDEAKATLTRRAKEIYRRDYGDGYGFVVMTFVLLTIIGGVISFFVQKLLNHFWPPKQLSAPSGIDVQFEEGDAP